MRALQIAMIIAAMACALAPLVAAALNEMQEARTICLAQHSIDYCNNELKG